MIQSLVALTAVIALVTMSLRANARFREEDRLPMQWSFKGAINWSAPRRLALAMTPVLAIIFLAATVVLTLTVEPRAGQEGFEVPVVLILALVFIGVHGFHLWMIGETLRRNVG